MTIEDLEYDIHHGDAATAALAQAKIDGVYLPSVSDTFAAAIFAADAANAANPDKYVDPQEDKAYVAELFDPYEKKVVESEEKMAIGDQYNSYGDELTLYTVLMALSLFILGVAAVLKKLRMQIMLVALSMIVFTFAAVLTAMVPFVALG